MLGYANLSEEKIKEAVRLLEKAWRPLKGSRRSNKKLLSNRQKMKMLILSYLLN